MQEEFASILGRALCIRHVDAGSCNGCELEIQALNNPYYNLEGAGIKFVASPRHADILLVTGPVSVNMEEALKRTYDAIPDPKLVIAVGDCGSLRRHIRAKLRQPRQHRERHSSCITPSPVAHRIRPLYWRAFSTLFFACRIKHQNPRADETSGHHRVGRTPPRLRTFLFPPQNHLAAR